MRPLCEEDVIRIMREEWDKKVARLAEAVDVALKANIGGDSKEVLSPGLKIRHKDSQIRYTVASVSPRDVILITPEGEKFIVDAAELESAYEID